MKIVIAPNAFKGSLTAFDAAVYIEKGIRRVFPRATIVKVPMADGGDGTMEVLASATGGRIKSRKVTGPLGRTVTARYASGYLSIGLRRGIFSEPSGSMRPRPSVIFSTIT